MKTANFNFFDAYSDALRLLYMGKMTEAESRFLAVVCAWLALETPDRDAADSAANASLQLGLTNARLGSLAEALWHFERAEAIGAKTRESALKAAFARFALGLLDDAEAGFKAILKDVPDEPEALIGLGRVQAGRGHYKRALAAFARAEDHGAPAVALVEKAIVLADMGDAAASLQAARAAIAADAKIHDSLLAKGDKFLFLGLPRMARFFLLRAEQTAPANPDVLYAIGYRFATLGYVADAERAYRAHLAQSPTIKGLRELADLYEKTNRVADAAKTLAPALRQRPGDPRLNYLMALTELRNGDAGAALARLEQVKDGAGDDMITKAEILNALGKAHDRAGNTGAAFASFAASKAALKASSDYRQIDSAGIRGVLEQSGALALDALPKAKPNALPHGPKEIVFLLGFYRSGTTLVEQILSGHPGVITAEERPILEVPMVALDKLEGGYPRALAMLSGAALSDLRRLYALAALNFTAAPAGKILVDKNPLHILHAPLIFSLFPDAKVVFMARHPLAVLMSCMTHNFTLNAATSMMLEAGEIVRFYVAAMRLWQSASAAAKPSLHVVKYEDLVRDLDGEGRKLSAFLGIDWRPAMRAFHETAKTRPLINTASYDQVVQPLYGHAAENWRRYERELAPFRGALAPFMEYLGYDA